MLNAAILRSKVLSYAWKVARFFITIFFGCLSLFLLFLLGQGGRRWRWFSWCFCCSWWWWWCVIDGPVLLLLALLRCCVVVAYCADSPICCACALAADPAIRDGRDRRRTGLQECVHRGQLHQGAHQERSVHYHQVRAARYKARAPTPLLKRVCSQGCSNGSAGIVILLVVAPYFVQQ